MKKLYPALALLLLLAACNKNETPANAVHITGNIKGFKQGKIYIKRIIDTAFVAVDSIIINGNPEFESTVKLDSPEMLYLVLDRGTTESMDNTLPFFAEPGEMHIESNNESFFTRAKVTGSENQKLYEDFLKMRSRFTNQRAELIAKNLEAQKSGNVQQQDSIEKQAELMTKRRYLYTANFAVNNKKHEIAPFLALSEISDANIKFLDTINNSITPEIAKSHYGKMLAKHIADRKAKEAANN